jgi:hypothetical protein
MSRHGADEVSGSPELQAKMMRSAGPAQMNAASRDELIMKMHKKGYTDAQIGKAVGLTRRGAAAAIQRIREGRPGRVRAE